MRKPMLRVLDLFSGIGGFSLGLERTGGFETVAFCEIDKFCQRVLAKHWPKVPIYDDIKELTGARLAADGIAVDVICGGFPCQDISFAGKRAGLEGARSGLWSEYGRLIGEVRPRFVIVENVPGLLSLGMGAVLGDLSALGYDAVWDCVPASAVGAPHRRDRVWLVGHADDGRQSVVAKHDETSWLPRVVADTGCGGIQPIGGAGELSRAPSAAQGEGDQRERLRTVAGHRGVAVANGHSSRLSASREISAREDRQQGRRVPPTDSWWSAEPDVGRVAHGVPSRVDRLRALGNAVVPQIPELIGKAILEAEGGQ